MNKLPKVTVHDIASELKALEQTTPSAYHSVEGNLDKANKALEEGNFTHSIYVLDRAIELNPDNPRLITERAKVYIYAKMYQDALEQVDYLLYLNPDNEDAKQTKEVLQQKIRYIKLVTAHPLYS